MADLSAARFAPGAGHGGHRGVPDHRIARGRARAADRRGHAPLPRRPHGTLTLRRARRRPMAPAPSTAPTTTSDGTPGQPRAGGIHASTANASRATLRTTSSQLTGEVAVAPKQAQG